MGKDMNRERRRPALNSLFSARHREFVRGTKRTEAYGTAYHFLKGVF